MSVAMASAVSSLSVRAMPSSSSESRQTAAPDACKESRQVLGTASALDVPGHHAQPAREVGGGAGVPLGDLMQARELVEEPAVEFRVAHPGNPVGALVERRNVHAPSLPPLPLP